MFNINSPNKIIHQHCTDCCFLPIVLAVNENSIMNLIGSAVWKLILSQITGRSKN